MKSIDNILNAILSNFYNIAPWLLRLGLGISFIFHGLNKFPLPPQKLIDYFGNKMFTFLVNVFFGGYWTDSLNESRIISRKAFNELNYDAMGMSSTQQMSIRGLKRKQKMKLKNLITENII